MQKNKSNNTSIDFLVIGAHRCATSWLYECLREHPQICLPKRRREEEYAGGPLYNGKGGLAWYLSLLKHCSDDKIKGGVSSEYMINEACPQILNGINPSMKFIVCKRNPVDRAMSAMKWYIRKGSLPEDETSLIDGFSRAVKIFSPGENIFSANTFHDVLHRGLYKKLMAPYYSLFKPAQFLVVQFDEIQNDPVAVVQGMYSFLRVKSDFVPYCIFNKFRKSSNHKLLMRIERRFSKNRLLSLLAESAHQLFPDNKNIQMTEGEKKIYDMMIAFYRRYKQFV